MVLLREARHHGLWQASGKNDLDYEERVAYGHLGHPQRVAIAGTVLKMEGAY